MFVCCLLVLVFEDCLFGYCCGGSFLGLDLCEVYMVVGEFVVY